MLPLNKEMLQYGQIDIQVRALIGTVTYIPKYVYGFAHYEFDGVEGDWSRTLTVTVDQPTSTPTSSLPSTVSQNNSNPSTSNQLDFKNSLFGLASWIGIALVILFSAIVVLLIIIVVHMRRKSAAQHSSSLSGV